MTGYTISKEECGNEKGITWSGRRGVLAISAAVDENYWGRQIRNGDWVDVEGFGPVRLDDTGVKAPWGVQGRERMDLLVARKEDAYYINSHMRHQRVWYIGQLNKY